MNKIAKVKVLMVRHLTESTFVLRVERGGFEFIPGQCVNIGPIPGAVNREYSTYSSVNESKYMEFLIKAVEGGIVSTKLRNLRRGEYVQLDGAYGKFTLRPENLKRPHVFIASGTGIAPFHSFVLSNSKLDYKIIHGVRYTKEQYDKADYKDSAYVACVSGETGGDYRGRVTNYLEENPPDLEAIYYLCGNSEMINDVYDILRRQGVNGSQIFTEVFF